MTENSQSSFSKLNALDALSALATMTRLFRVHAWIPQCATISAAYMYSRPSSPCNTLPPHVLVRGIARPRRASNRGSSTPVLSMEPRTCTPPTHAPLYPQSATVEQRAVDPAAARAAACRGTLAMLPNSSTTSRVRGSFWVRRGEGVAVRRRRAGLDCPNTILRIPNTC